MALGIENDSVYKTLSIPLMSAFTDEHWTDNTWLIQHLRQLADYIEENNPQVYKIGLETNSQYKVPYLQITCFKK